MHKKAASQANRRAAEATPLTASSSAAGDTSSVMTEGGIPGGLDHAIKQ
jgi:hypothetical protein